MVLTVESSQVSLCEGVTHGVTCSGACDEVTLLCCYECALSGNCNLIALSGKMNCLAKRDVLAFRKMLLSSTA